jgi:L-ribulokinase
MGEKWLDRYGGKISSEWFFSKALQILQESPEIYHAADRLLEAADWIIWQLTGVETRNACTAGYKAMVQEAFPRREYFAALIPLCRCGQYPDEQEFAQLGEGGVGELRQVDGLKEAAVAVANVDAHVTAVATSRADGHDNGHVHLPYVR